MRKIFLVILMCFMLFGCSHIEDTNGSDDYSIVTYSNDDILNKSSSHIMVGYSESIKSFGGKTSGEIKCNKFSGIKNIKKSKYNSKVNIDIKCNVTSGNFMVVVIYDNMIYKTISANKSSSFSMNVDGYLTIKIVGESAKFDVEFSIS